MVFLWLGVGCLCACAVVVCRALARGSHARCTSQTTLTRATQVCGVEKIHAPRVARLVVQADVATDGEAVGGEAAPTVAVPGRQRRRRPGGGGGGGRRAVDGVEQSGGVFGRGVSATAAMAGQLLGRRAQVIDVDVGGRACLFCFCFRE